MNSECTFNDDETGVWSMKVRVNTVHDNYDEPDKYFLDFDSHADSVGIKLTGPEVCELFDVVSDAYMAYCESLDSETVAVSLTGTEVEALVLGRLTTDHASALLRKLHDGLPAERVDALREVVFSGGVCEPLTEIVEPSPEMQEVLDRIKSDAGEYVVSEARRPRPETLGAMMDVTPTVPFADLMATLVERLAEDLKNKSSLA